MSRTTLSAGLIGLIIVLSGCDGSSTRPQTPVAASPSTEPAAIPVAPNADQVPAGDRSGSDDNTASPAGHSRELFNGTDLTGWKVSQFGGDGEVVVIDGEIDLESGNPLTGISWNGAAVPTDNYRISLEAKRTSGIDFFCCLTFPVRDSHCSLVVGGWSGTVVGLSSIDGQDASNNDTTRIIAFDDDRWYQIEVAVGGDSIEAWIDGKSVLKHPVGGHEFEVRNEVRLSRPLGICTFEVDARIRNLRLHSAPAMETGN